MGRFGSAPTKFDEADLGPLSARVIGALPYDAVADEVRALGVPDALAEQFWDVVRENIDTRAAAATWWSVFQNGPEGNIAELLGEDAGFARDALAELPEPPFTSETWGTWTAALKDRTGRKGRALFRPLRIAVTGAERGPEMADVMPLLQHRPGL